MGVQCGNRAQNLRRGAGETEKLQVSRNLFKQHVRTNLEAATPCLHSSQEGCHLGFHDHFTDKGGGGNARHVHWHRVAFIHAQGRTVDNQIEASRIVATCRDFKKRVVPGQSLTQTLR